jgi:integrase
MFHVAVVQKMLRIVYKRREITSKLFRIAVVVQQVLWHRRTGDCDMHDRERTELLSPPEPILQAPGRRQGTARDAVGQSAKARRNVGSFRATRKAIHELIEEAESDAERRKWLKLELALVLAEATGRRLGSIRQLAWNDIDFTSSTILWRADTDKKRKAWTLPMPRKLRDEIKLFRAMLGSAFGPLIFPSHAEANVPVSKDMFSQWLRAAEKKAELPKLDSSLWHAYRREWASERKHLSLVDVAAAGGWKDTQTLLTCYQQPDRATMLAVMGESRKVTECVKAA